MGGWRSYLAWSVGIAVLYGAAYAGIREISIASVSLSNWIPLAGLRLSCLLLVRPRFWPALIVGELVPLSYQNHQSLDQFGLTWVLANSVPPMSILAPGAWLVRSRLPGLANPVARNMGYLLGFAFVASIAKALQGLISYSLLKQLAPGEQPLPYDELGCQYFLGAYLGALSITPLILLIARAVRRAQAEHRLSFLELGRFARSSNVFGMVCLLVVVAAMILLGRDAGANRHQLALIGIMAALLTAASLYGWQGTAIIGAASNVAIVMMMPASNDLTTLYAQAFMAVGMTGLLMLGARTTLSEHLAARMQAAMDQARHELLMMEQSRFATATGLKEALSGTRKEATKMMHLVRDHLPAKAIAQHYGQFDDLHRQHQRITAGMSPNEWLEFGGQDGAIAEALALLGVQCEIRHTKSRQRLNLVSSETHIALYRLACEAVVHLMDQAPSDLVRLGMDVSRLGEGLVVEAVVESLGADIVLPLDARQRLIMYLGAAGLSEQAMRNRAHLYDGDLVVSVTSPAAGRVHVRLVEKVVESL